MALGVYYNTIPIYPIFYFRVTIETERPQQKKDYSFEKISLLDIWVPINATMVKTLFFQGCSIEKLSEGKVAPCGDVLWYRELRPWGSAKRPYGNI